LQEGADRRWRWRHRSLGRCAGAIFGDLRDRVAATLASGTSARAAAGRSGVSVSTAIRWAQRSRAEGHARAACSSARLTHRCSPVCHGSGPGMGCLQQQYQPRSPSIIGPTAPGQSPLAQLRAFRLRQPHRALHKPDRTTCLSVTYHCFTLDRCRRAPLRRPHAQAQTRRRAGSNPRRSHRPICLTRSFQRRRKDRAAWRRSPSLL
jgi:hypothetical protein